MAPREEHHGPQADSRISEETRQLLLKQGQPIEAVSRWLGHSTLQITMKHYADVAKRRATVDLSALMPADVAEFQPAALATHDPQGGWRNTSPSN